MVEDEDTLLHNVLIFFILGYLQIKRQIKLGEEEEDVEDAVRETDK